jgi:hypothetical protein
MLLEEGPLMVGIYANTNFQYYSGGIFNGCSTTTNYYSMNHAVLLYGWDSSGSWLIKNSWGVDWGENGFMRLAPARNCGINKEIAIKIVQRGSKSRMQLSTSTASTRPPTLI